MKHYRQPWNEENTSYLTEWWPHFGTYAVADDLGLTRPQFKAKADKMKLKLLPKGERMCVVCREERQVSRRYGLRCRACSLSARRGRNSSMEAWLSDRAREFRYRSVKLHNIESDITTEFLADLWEKQDGKCYYTGEPLLTPINGDRTRRDWRLASLDRVDPSGGYTTSNVVWACWAANHMKRNLTLDEFYSIADKVIRQRKKHLSVANPR
jgi:hypothetical protein